MTWSAPTKSATKIELVFRRSPEPKGHTLRRPAMVSDLKIHYSNINWNVVCIIQNKNLYFLFKEIPTLTVSLYNAWFFQFESPTRESQKSLWNKLQTNLWVGVLCWCFWFSMFERNFYWKWEEPHWNINCNFTSYFLWLRLLMISI